MIYGRLREDMLRGQVMARGIKNARVIEAMRSVERHLFVPENVREKAYGDFPLPIGDNQTISQPYIVALMTELVCPAENETVLEIGTGSGYQTAILSLLAKEVYTVERIAGLSQQARLTLEMLGYANVRYRTGDGYGGFPEFAPYDAIVVTCAPDSVPDTLTGQLKEGGRMVIPVGRQGEQVLYFIRHVNGGIVTKEISYVRFVPMVHD